MDWAVILAGGSGTRFWPLSSPRHPKQLLPLAGPTSTAVAALAAIEPVVTRERILVVTGPDLADPLEKALGLAPAQFLIEPRPASTAPALAWAAHTVLGRDPSATVLSMHADWHLADPAAFRIAAGAALAAAREHDALVTVGIVPSRAETGYGYIVPGEALGSGVYAVRTFREKPDQSTARQLVAEGALWNSGLFAWTARRFLEEIRQHAPEVAVALPRLEADDAAGFFAAVGAVAVDVAVLERSTRVRTIRGTFPWDDLGTWDALMRVRATDSTGNVTQGPVHSVDAGGCVAWADEDTPIVLDGVRDLVVIHANGRILVMHRARAADLKRTLERLPAAVRDLE